MSQAAKSILIVSYYLPPNSSGASRRLTFFANHLVKMGYSVFMFGPRQTDGPYLDARISDLDERVVVHRSPAPNLNLFRRSKNGKGEYGSRIWVGLASKIKNWLPLDRGVFWVVAGLFTLAKLVRSKGIDVMITSSPLFSTLIFGLRGISQGVHWLADFRDFYFTDHIEKKGSRFSGIHRWLERKAIDRAELVTFVTIQMRESYALRYPSSAHKFKVVPNGYEQLNSPTAIHHNQQKPMKRIAYLGTFYDGERDPRPLLQILDRLLKTKVIDRGLFQIEIIGEIGNSLTQVLKQEDLNYLIDKASTKSHHDAIGLLAEADLAWLVIPDLPWHYKTIPVKFYEYIAAQKPIMAFVPPHSAVASIIEEYAIGWVFDGSLTKEAIDLVENIINDEYEIKRIQSAYRKNLQKLQTFKRSVGAKKLEDLIKTL